MRVAPVLCAAALAVGGCHLWYKPVPIESAIGKERTFVAGDSFSVYRDPRFEIYGIGSQAVFDAYEQLNRTYRTFDRYFGAPVPRLAVVLSTSGARSDRALDDTLRIRGLTPLRYSRPRNSVLQERLGGVGYEGSLWPLGPYAARVLLAGMTTAPTPATSPVDTAALVVFPAWFRAAVMHLVGDASSLPIDVAYAKENRDALLVVDRLVTARRAPTADTVLDSYRRSTVSDAERRFASQSSAFAQFLLEREGPDVLLRLARGYAARRSFEAMSGEFKSAPATIAEIEERWLAWLDAQRTPWW